MLSTITATQYIQQMTQMQEENQQRIDRLLKERDDLQRYVQH